MKKVNLGLIGLGTQGKVHLHNCLRLKDAKLVAVADKSKKSLHFAKRVGIKNLCEDYNALLKNPEIDAVIVSLPTFLHLECAQKAAEKGKDIFMEKPLARNATEGEQILSHVKREGVKLMVGYPSRFSEPFIKLKNKLQKGLLGDVQVAVATNIGAGPFSQRAEKTGPAQVPAWWLKKELTGGGALLDLGVHIIHLLTWYFGEANRVKSYLGYRFNMDLEDHAICLLKFKNGPVATVNVGWFSKEAKIGVELYGTAKHTSEIRLANPSLLGFALNTLKRKIGQTTSSFRKELQYFVECINSNTPPSPSAEEGLLDLKTISMAYNTTFQIDL